VCGRVGVCGVRVVWCVCGVWCVCVCVVWWVCVVCVVCVCVWCVCVGCGGCVWCVCVCGVYVCVVGWEVVEADSELCSMVAFGSS